MGNSSGKDFLGFPIPSAAGLVASLTLLIIQLNEKDRVLPAIWRYVLAAVLLFLSAMMVSTVKYPSFKSLGLRSTTTFIKAIVAAMIIGLLVFLKERILYIVPLFFTLYLIYGFIRPHISRKVRSEIEEEDEEEDPTSEKSSS
jgi:CDP-diacylglycerol--serine O-phosphatidyltransferase